jgi:transcriptional regulator with XRE-family HTH domain
MIIDILKKHRKLAGITIKEMAGYVGVTTETLSHYENYHRKMPINIAEKYCEALEMELKILVKEKP